MTDNDTPETLASPPHRMTRGARSWVLGGVLSLILITGWAMFLAVAPTPESLPQPAPVADAAPAPSASPSNQVRLLAWRNAIDADVLAAFAADTGIKVVVDGYDTNEQLLAMPTDGITQDVVLLSGVGLKVLAERGGLLALDKTQLANARNIDPSLAARTEIYDSGNTHSVPLLWGTIGLGFNAAKVAERLGADAALDSWAALFDPAKAAKLADCGIQVIDTPTGVFPIALTYLGLPADTAKIEDTDAAARAWGGIRPSITKFSSHDIIDNLAAGHVCLAVATSGDAYQARARARMAGLAADIRYVLPKEGTVLWYNFLAVSKASTNSANALRLIDYLLRPEVAARLTNAKGFANAVVGSALYVKPEIKSDAALLPDLATLKVTEEMSPTPEAVALRNRFWQLINAPPPPPAAEKPATP
jgi:putrescine transport system substrate-binding protein